MSQVIYLKSIFAGFLSVAVSHAMEQSDKITPLTHITSIERVNDNNNFPFVQQKASINDIWMCIYDNKFHRTFKADLVNNVLPNEVKVAIHQIDSTVKDEIMLSVLKSVAKDEDNPLIIAFDDDIENGCDIECDDF